MLTQRELVWIIHALKPKLEGSIIQRVYERDDEHRTLQCRRPGETLFLMLGVHPTLWRAHLVEGKPTQPSSPSGTTMFLRKWLQGTVIHELSVIEGERILRIDGDTPDPAWEPPDEDSPDADQQKPPRIKIALIVEWLGKTTNMFLLGPDDEILHQWRADRLERKLKPGKRYALPPHELAAASEAQDNRWEGLEGEPSALIAQTYESRDQAWELQNLRQELNKRIKQQLRRARRLVANLEVDLERAVEAQAYRKFGELLQGAYKTYKKGMTQVEVPDYYEEGMPLLTIELDPSRGLQDNIARYFKQYKRLHDAADQIETRQLEAMERVDALETARASVAAMTQPEQLREALLTWERSGLLPEPKVQQQGKRGEPTERQRPYRAYLSSKGTVLFVGKGSKGNDHLCTRMARGRDIWLHARDWAGAHVLIRMERQQQLNQSDLWEAAQLAAHFSKGVNDTLVDVTYTEAKNIRKPKGYPPGMVTVAGGSTLAVTPDPEKVQQVLGRATDL